MDNVTGFEIPVKDLRRAKRFYGKVFGWKVDLWDEEYSHVKTVPMDKNWVPKEKGAVNGGMFKKGSGADKVLLVISVASINSTMKKAKSAGGTIVTPKTEAGEWGWWAEVKDKEGNVFELWEDK